MSKQLTLSSILAVVAMVSLAVVSAVHRDAALTHEAGTAALATEASLTL